MIDLYRRIGLAVQVEDQDVIERVIAVAARSDARSARAARHVLLNRERKAVYDRTRDALVLVGQLRANLGLSRSPNWLISDCSDFDPMTASATSQLGAFRDRLQRPTTDRRGTGAGKFAGVGVGIVLLCGCIIAGYFDTQATENRRRRTTPSKVPSQHTPPRASPPNNNAVRPVEPREEKIRRLVAKRFDRAGLAPDAAMVEVAVRKLSELKADPLPLTGVLARNFVGDGVAPLEIKTHPGRNYYIKVVNWTTKSEVMTAFINGGEPFETTVPVGSYEIKYASGAAWYGRILDFGESASYSRCDDRFDFSRTLSGYNGYTIELILQQNGNLETDPISADDF